MKPTASLPERPSTRRVSKESKVSMRNLSSRDVKTMEIAVEESHVIINPVSLIHGSRQKRPLTGAQRPAEPIYESIVISLPQEESATKITQSDYKPVQAQRPYTRLLAASENFLNSLCDETKSTKIISRENSEPAFQSSKAENTVTFALPPNDIHIDTNNLMLPNSKHRPVRNSPFHANGVS